MLEIEIDVIDQRADLAGMAVGLVSRPASCLGDRRVHPLRAPVERRLALRLGLRVAKHIPGGDRDLPAGRQAAAL